MLVVSCVLFLVVFIAIKVADDWIREKHYRKSIVVYLFFLAVITLIIGILQYIFG